MAYKALSLTLLFIELSLLYVIGNILKHLPCFKRMIVKKMNKKASIPIPVDNYWDTLFSWSLIQTLWKFGKYELNKTSRVGQVAPNTRLVAGEKGRTRVHLLDLVQHSRPLVVVFGSCTCPVTIAKLDQMFDAQRQFADIADFVMIYVQEAHPDDGWRMKVGRVCIALQSNFFTKVLALSHIFETALLCLTLKTLQLRLKPSFVSNLARTMLNPI